MNAQRNLGFLLVLLQAVMLVICFHTPLFSAAVVAAALVGTASNIRFASTDVAARRWPLVLAVMYIVQRAVVPIGWYSSTNGFLFPRSCLIAEYFLAYQVLQFFVRRDGNRLPRYFPILAIVVMTFTADVQVNMQGRLIVQSLVVAFVALVAVFLAACRLHRGKPSQASPRWHAVLLAFVLVTIGAVGWGAASSLNRYARDIEMALGAVMQSSGRTESAGFSGQGRLGSVARQKGTAGSRVALRVFADDAPGYLRGRAFDTYAVRQWQNNATQLTVTANDTPVEPSANTGHTFQLIPIDDGPGDRLDIWPNRPYGEVVFVPSGTTSLRAPVAQVLINMHGIVEAKDLPPDASYTVWRRTAADTVTISMGPAGELSADGRPQEFALGGAFLDDWKRLTLLPEDLDPRIRDLAERVVAGATTDGEKIAAIEEYLLENYEYQFGIEIPFGVDPLTHFLMERPPAHCEFFASGAAVLLRAAGVPCRYVTGFVATETNEYGGYWVARNRDAHAWAEAFDSECGWVLVEATPAGGVPQTTSVSNLRQIWDALKANWQRFAASVRKEGIAAIAGAAGRLLKRPTTLVVLLIGGAVYALRRFWRRPGETAPVERDPFVIQLLTLLRQMDRRWSKIGLARLPHETLHQFARRIESAAPEPVRRQAADWYRDFAAARYGGHVDAHTVQALQDAMATMFEAAGATTGAGGIAFFRGRSR